MLQSFNYREAASQLGVSLRTLYRYVSNGTIKCRRDGRSVRFSQANINAARKRVGR